MIESIPTLVARDVNSSVDDLPTLSTTSTLTTSSIEYSTITITHIPQSNNPYIIESNLPTNLIFVIVGSILGAMFISMSLYRIITYIKYSRQANREKETYYSNLDEVLNGSYSYSRNSSLLDLNLTNSSPPTSSSSTQGRSYRDNMLGNSNNNNNNNNNNNPNNNNNSGNMGSTGNNKNNINRGSMFIRPTLDLKSFDLPLYQTQHNTSSASLLMKCINNNNNNNNDNNSTIFDEKNIGRIIFERNDSSIINGSIINSSISDSKYSLPQKNPIRAPSMVLEDILNEEIRRSLSEKDISEKDISKQKEEEEEVVVVVAEEDDEEEEYDEKEETSKL